MSDYKKIANDLTGSLQLSQRPVAIAFAAVPPAGEPTPRSRSAMKRRRSVGRRGNGARRCTVRGVVRLSDLVIS